MRSFKQLAMIQAETTAPEMTTGGWIFMLAAWIAIILLVIFTFSKVLRNRDRK